jgi:hypothetical protein
MSNYSMNRNQRIYAVVETTFATAAAVTGSNCMLITKAVFKPLVDTLTSQSKTGTRSVFPGVPGRHHATFSIEMELRTNGTAGVKPDCDPLLQAIFGQAGVAVVATSVTYALSDSIPSLTIYNYRTPSTISEQVAIGCVLQRATFKLGDNIATVTFTGVCFYVADTNTLATILAGGSNLTPGAGGLSSIAAEPGTPVVNGGIIAGFTGSATIDTNLFLNLRTAEIDINLNNDIPLDVFGSYFGGAPEGDARDVGFTFSLYDDDSAGTADMDVKALTKAGVTAVMAIGTVAGSIYTFTVKGVQLETPDRTEGQRKWQANVSRSRATGSTLTAKDEVGLVLT